MYPFSIIIRVSFRRGRDELIRQEDLQGSSDCIGSILQCVTAALYIGNEEINIEAIKNQ